MEGSRVNTLALLYEEDNSQSKPWCFVNSKSFESVDHTIMAVVWGPHLATPEMRLGTRTFKFSCAIGITPKRVLKRQGPCIPTVVETYGQRST